MREPWQLGSRARPDIGFPLCGRLVTPAATVTTSAAARPVSRGCDGSQRGQQTVDGRLEDSAAVLVVPVATIPTGDRPFSVRARRHAHRPQIFLAFPYRGVRDRLDGKCCRHARLLPFRVGFSGRKTR